MVSIKTRSLSWLLATTFIFHGIEAFTYNSTSLFSNSTSATTSTSTSFSSSISSSVISSSTYTSITPSAFLSTNTSAAPSPTSLYSNASTVFSASIPLFTPNATGVAYRNSSQCTSAALAYYSSYNTSVLTDFASVGVFTMTAPPGSTATSVITGQDSYTNSAGVITHPTFTFTLTGPTTTIFTDPAAYPTEDALGNCCGVCSMPIFRPTIYYWPSGTPNTACLATCTGSSFLPSSLAPTSTSPASSSVSLSSASITSNTFPTYTPHSGTSTTYGNGGAGSSTPIPEKPTTTSTTEQTSTTSSMSTFSEMIPSQYSIITMRAEPSDIPNLDANGGSMAQYTVGPDGFTYTSPYIYLVLTSVLALPGRSECGPVGSTYTNVRYSFLPGELSTVEFRVASTRALDFNDLPCPNSDVMWRNGWNDGSCGYQPFIAPLTQVQELDPSFRDCWLPGCGLWDPPRPLTPEGSLWITTSAPDPGPTPPSPQSQVSPQPSQSMFNPAPAGSLGSDPQDTGGIVPAPSPDPPPSNPSSDPPSGGDPTTGDPSSGGDPGSGISPQPGNTASPAPSPDITPGPTPGPAPLVIGSATAVFQSSTLIIGTNTITPGAPAVIISGTPVSLAPSATAVVIGSSTIALPPPGSPAPAGNNGGSPSPLLSVSGITFTSSPGGLIVGGQTITPGGPPVVVSGTTIALPGSGSGGGGGIGSSIIIDGSTVALPAPTPAAGSVSPVTIAGATFTPVPGTGSGSGPDLIVSGQTLVPGGAPVTIGATVYSLPPGASSLIIDGTSTAALPSNIAPLPDSPITVNGATFTPVPDPSGSGPDLIISGQTITPGGTPVVVSGTTYSLLPGATSLIIDGSTIPLPPIVPATAANPVATASLLTISADGQTFTFSASGSDLVIDGQTLTPGGSVVTIGNDTFSLVAGGGDLIVDGSSTLPLAETTVDVGGLVYTAWVGSAGTGPTASATVGANGTVMVFTGAATGLQPGLKSMAAILAGLAGLMVWL